VRTITGLDHELPDLSRTSDTATESANAIAGPTCGLAWLSRPLGLSGVPSALDDAGLRKTGK
jgi:hypothetical protein